jgi:uncharacterized protein YqgV (UPF0045/DUF77 family)
MTQPSLPLPKTDPLICVQVSVYALDGRVREAVHAYLAALDATDIERDTGSMSTVVWGTASAVWTALQSAYQAVAADYKVMVNTSMSNAAPLPARASAKR